MTKNKKLDLSELKKLVFEKNQVTKQNKDRLFKLAKAEKDIECLERLRGDFGFKNAIKFIDDLKKKQIEQLFQHMDTESIKSAINNGMDPNTQDEEGASFLHFAAEQDNRVLVEFLIDKDANINLQQNDGATPLLLASQNNNYETMKFLIQNYADVDLKSIDGYTPLMSASAMFNNIDAVNLLLDNEADLNACDINGVSPLLMASQQNYTSIVKILLDNNANPNLIDKNGYNSLHMPCEKGHENIVKLLLLKGVDINTQDKDGDTPLIIASKNGFKNIVELLLNKNAKLDLQNKNGDTALMRASYGNHFEVVKLLVERKADVELVAKDGTTALDFSMKHNNNLMTDFLIDSGANKIFLKGKVLNPILQDACSKGNKKLIQLFLDNGADINFRSSNGNTPLITASNYGHLDIVNILINNGASLDSVNNVNITALKIASMRGYIDIARSLLEKGANPDITDENRMTALASIVASRMDRNNISATTAFIKEKNDQNVRIARLLLSKGANPDVKNKYDSPILIMASRIGDIEMVNLLLDKGAKVDIQENTGMTALSSAAFANHTEVCNILLEHEADVNKLSANDDSTALSAAIMNNNLDLVKLLVKKGADPHQISTGCLNSTPFGAHPNDMRRGTALELARQCDFQEILSFLLAQIKKSEEDKMENDLPKGKILLKNNLSIDIYTNYLFFISKIDNEVFEDKYHKDGENKFYNEKKGYIVIDKDIVKRESLVGEVTVYDIKSYKGEILDINDTHNPKLLSKELQKFSDSDNLSYTNHEWDSYTPQYDDFMKNVRLGWSELQAKLKILLAKNVYEDIEKFLFANNLGEKDKNGCLISWSDDITVGWSSKVIVEEIKNGTKPNSINITNSKNAKIKTFGDVIDIFKNYFVIKNNLLKKFTKLRKENKYKIKLNLDSLKETSIDKFFTDVNRFENALGVILSEMEERYEDDNGNIFKDVVVEVEEKVIKDINYTELKIIHIGSKSNQSRERLVDTINRSKGFKSIYTNLRSVCDWSIDTECSDGKRYKIDYLYPEIDNDKPHCNEINDIFKGFTHILRFYR